MQDAGEAIREGAGEVGERLRGGYESARETVAHRYRRTEGMIARNPSTAVMIGFGVGFGLGMLLTLALTEPEETWWERNVPDSLRDLPERLRHARIPESIARRMPRR